MQRCFIFTSKEIEKKRLESMLMSKHNNIKFKINGTSFEGNTDFFSGGIECELKMQDIVNHYANAHEATGGEVQNDKVIMHGRKWKNYKIVKVPMNVTMSEEKIRMINVKDSIKTLGTCTSPSLC